MPEATDDDKLYSTLRDYLKHEDSLINWRITWNLGLQTALFAGFGWLAKKPALADGVPLSPDVVGYALYVLPVVAQLIGLSIYVGIIAAHRAQSGVNEKWSKATDPDPRAKYPGVCAGGDGYARVFGILTPIGPIVLLQLSWVGILSTMDNKWVAGGAVVANAVGLLHPPLYANWKAKRDGKQ